MILSLSNQVHIFITSVVIGIISGIIYDIIKIFRIAIKHNNFIIQLEDALFWIGITFFSFTAMISRNFGDIRFFNIIGIFSGMILYILTVSPIIIGLSEKIIYIIKYILRLFITIITTPLRLIYIIMLKPVIKLIKHINKRCEKLLHLIYFCAKIKTKSFMGKTRTAKDKKQKDWVLWVEGKI